MAGIIGGISTSHIPTIGNAIYRYSVFKVLDFPVILATARSVALDKFQKAM